MKKGIKEKGLIKRFSEIVEKTKNRPVKNVRVSLLVEVILLLIGVLLIIYFAKERNVFSRILWTYVGSTIIGVAVFGVSSLWVSNGLKKKELSEIIMMITLLVLFVIFIPYDLIYRIVRFVFMEKKDDFKDAMNLCIVFAIELTIYCVCLLLIEQICLNVINIKLTSNSTWLSCLIWLLVIITLYLIMFNKKCVTLIRRMGLLTITREYTVSEDEHICDSMKKIFVFILLLSYMGVSCTPVAGPEWDGIKDAITVLTLYILFVDKKKEYSGKLESTNENHKRDVKGENEDIELDFDQIDRLYAEWNENKISREKYLK